MKGKIFLIFSGMALLMVSACYYDVEEKLYPSTECDTADVRYQTTVQPIIQSNCLVCHSQSASNGNVVLEGYTNLKRYVDNGKLLGSIKHQSGFSPMPQNQPQLLDCEIAKIDKWVQDGALNN